MKEAFSVDIDNELSRFCFSPSVNGAVPVHRQAGHRDRSSLHLSGEDPPLHQGQTALSPSIEAFSLYPFPAVGDVQGGSMSSQPSRPSGEDRRSLQQAWSGEGISIRVSKSMCESSD